MANAFIIAISSSEFYFIKKTSNNYTKIRNFMICNKLVFQAYENTDKIAINMSPIGDILFAYKGSNCF